MIVYKLILFLFFSVFLFNQASALEQVNDLQKRGQGTAYYLGFIKVYDATLYGSDFKEVNSVLSSDVSKCLHLTYDVDLEKKVFVESADTILERQFTEGQLAQVQQYINQLHDGYQDVEEGDSYSLCYDRESQQTTLALNNSTLVSITSAEFAEVYFSIWLGAKKPLDDDLRDDLLAGYDDK